MPDMQLVRRIINRRGNVKCLVAHKIPPQPIAVKITELLYHNNLQLQAEQTLFKKKAEKKHPKKEFLKFLKSCIE
jgi:hypothetical protein